MDGEHSRGRVRLVLQIAVRGVYAKTIAEWRGAVGSLHRREREGAGSDKGGREPGECGVYCEGRAGEAGGKLEAGGCGTAGRCGATEGGIFCAEHGFAVDAGADCRCEREPG